VQIAGTGVLVGVAALGLMLGSVDAGAVSEDQRPVVTRAQAPAPTLAGKFRTTLRVKSGGKPFGQKRGDVVTRTWSFKERCGKISPCDRVKLVRKGRSGRFGSMLRRRGADRWRGVEKVRGRCADGLSFRSKATIAIRAVELRGREVAEFTGSFNARVRGCVKGRERAVLRGRLR
jgi:hypothetical protein